MPGPVSLAGTNACGGKFSCPLKIQEGLPIEYVSSHNLNASQWKRTMRIDTNIDPAMIVQTGASSQPAAEKETGSGGDVVRISEQAKELSKERAKNLDGALQSAGNSEEGDESSSELRIRELEKRIKELQEQIRELEKSDLPEKQKQQRVQALQQELTTLQEELGKLKSGNSTTATGAPNGTAAAGFPSSLT